MQLLPGLHGASSSPNADIHLASCSISFDDKLRGGGGSSTSSDYYPAGYPPPSGHLVSLELPHDNHTLNVSVVALLIGHIQKVCVQRGIHHLWIALVYDDWMKAFLEEECGFEPCRCSKDIDAINSSQGSVRYCKNPINNYQYGGPSPPKVEQQLYNHFMKRQDEMEDHQAFSRRGRIVDHQLGDERIMTGRKRNAISPPGNYEARTKRRAEATYLKEEDSSQGNTNTQLIKRNSSSSDLSRSSVS